MQRFKFDDRVLILPKFAHLYPAVRGTVRAVKPDPLRSVFNEYTVEFTYGVKANIFEFQMMEDLPSYITLIANVAFDSSLQMAQTSARGKSDGTHIVLNVNEFDVDLKIQHSKGMRASIL